MCITEKKFGFRDRGSERGPTQGVREESERDGGREGERERDDYVFFGARQAEAKGLHAALARAGVGRGFICTMHYTLYLGQNSPPPPPV